MLSCLIFYLLIALEGTAGSTSSPHTEPATTTTTTPTTTTPTTTTPTTTTTTTTTTTPTTTTTLPTTTTTAPDNVAAIACGVIFGLIGVALIIVAIIFLVRWRRKKRPLTSDPEEEGHEYEEFSKNVTLRPAEAYSSLDSNRTSSDHQYSKPAIDNAHSDNQTKIPATITTSNGPVYNNITKPNTEHISIDSSRLSGVVSDTYEPVDSSKRLSDNQQYEDMTLSAAASPSDNNKKININKDEFYKTEYINAPSNPKLYGSELRTSDSGAVHFNNSKQLDATEPDSYVDVSDLRMSPPPRPHKRKDPG
ncbi:mucin-2-like [Physella acuta]|uniref:mucin-2-like n=1 Tax=Physella acuta TaxID=109671 RepID=UPI0027DE5CB5|nr:mucin-2-like [Physella acuta]